MATRRDLLWPCVGSGPAADFARCGSLPHSIEERTHTFAVLAALAGVAGIVVFLILGSGVTAPRPPGVVQTTEIKVAPEISGRLAGFAVTQGQSVHQGDDLVELINPELSAALVLARAQVGEVRAARDRVYAGVRSSRSPFSHAKSKRLARICSTPSSNSGGNRSSPRTASRRDKISMKLPRPSYRARKACHCTGNLPSRPSRADPRGARHRRC